MKNRIRTLLLQNPSTGGRNNTGKQTIRHRGGATKHLYRQIDWKRNILQLSATVLRIEKDPNRNCFIALICYKHGLLTYIISPHGLCCGDKIESGIKVAPTLGNTMLLKYILIGSFLQN
jgi:large subunit ribosomal protein L2